MSYEMQACGLVNGDVLAFVRNAGMAKIIDASTLKAELAKKGRSQAALARHLGIDQSSVNRMVNDERKIKIAELPLIEDYLQATGDAPFRTETVTTVPVVGAVEAGAWREPSLGAGGEAIPVVALENSDDLFALRVAGPSMNLKYSDGSYVIARKWQGGPWPVGKNVVVQRTDASGKVETTLKELALGERGLELWPRSTDPRFQDPVPYDDGDSTVEIIGRVVSSWRPED